VLRKVGVSGVFCNILQYKYHSQSLFTWEEVQVVRDIADVDNGTWSPECLLSRDLFGPTETLYVLMHFLSIGNF
jgi:hypothetical protein